jgi:hypothetical protein
MPTVDDTPRNRDRDGWDYLEGRGTPPPGSPAPSNVVKFPVEPPAHIAKAQVIRANAGILPIVTTPEPPAVVSDERGLALMVRLIANRVGYGKPPKEPWER